jgi:hypothetical protein
VLSSSCAPKEKTYEELEAEVLCDVLPQLAHEFIMTNLPPPPPEEKDYEKYNYKPLSKEEFIEYIKIQKDSIKLLANQKHRITISIIDNLFELEKKDFKTNQNIFYRKSIIDRFIKDNELINSTIKLELKHFDSVSKWKHFEENSALIRASRVYINKHKNKAYFELYPFGSMPTNFKIISEKKNNKWVVKEIIKE